MVPCPALPCLALFHTGVHVLLTLRYVGEHGGVLRKAASIAASVLGPSGGMKSEGRGKAESPAAVAAQYLGADTVDLTVDSVKQW